MQRQSWDIMFNYAIIYINKNRAADPVTRGILVTDGEIPGDQIIYFDTKNKRDY